MRLWICRYFAAEARAAAAGVPELAQATIHAFPACCGCPALPAAAIRAQIATIPVDEPMVWMGGICLQPLLKELADERRIQLHLLKQCFHLVADPDWVDAQLRDGAYLCTPGWLADWPDHLARMGLTTPELARDLFGESIQRLVLLDTGQDPQAAVRLAALAAYVGRPAETVWIGLGYLRLYLIGLNERLGREAERQQAAALLADARRQASEVVMAMDFLGRLATAQHQSEAIIQLLDLLTALFAPQQLFYVAVENGQIQPPVTAQPLPDAHLEAVAEFFAGTAPYAEIDAGQGFLLRICHGAETLGVFGIGRFALPQYARQYLNLALHLADLCGLALTRARTSEQLRASETRYQTLFTSMQEGFALHEILCDSQGRPVDYRFMDINPAFERLTGLKRENLIGRTVREVMPGTEEHWIQRYGAVALTGVAQRFENFSGELDRHYDLYAYSPMRGWFVVIFSDITARKQAEKHIHHLAHYDPLTDLPNRALLGERTALALALAARRQENLALLVCDLDHFKEINDTLGHAVGDALLTQMAARIRMTLRGTDTVARLGGDEFVMLLPAAARDEAAQVAEKLLVALREPLELAGHHLTVTGSIGICLYPHDGTTFAALLQNADVAMYRAKHGGRHQFRFYDAAINADMLERLTLLAELENAVHGGQLRTYYQPKVMLADGRLMGAEALVHWQHPKKGLLSPGRFIPVAEDTEMIVAIGEWVLEDVCRQLAAWRAGGGPTPTVAVNLAARHFREPRLAERLAALLTRHDLPATALALELTESTLLEANAETAATINALRKLGLRLDIDDFGTGYSNLAYLKNLPIAAIKIDRSFVRDIENDPADRAIAAAAVALSHNLGLIAVAEGVETEGQLAILLEQGCDCAQGYLFSPPLPAEEFAAWSR